MGEVEKLLPAGLLSTLACEESKEELVLLLHNAILMANEFGQRSGTPLSSPKPVEGNGNPVATVDHPRGRPRR